ncbi:MAG: sulfotransferase [Chloroflexi bacterium]|nr:sulfotransferase [Chloroflexota bacterium]
MLTLEYSGSNLLFVVGCPRSGTTWVQRLLASHPRIRTGQESDVFDQYIGPQLRAWEHELDPAASGRGGVGLGCYFEDSEFRRLLKGYLLELLEPMAGGLQPGELFLEKTPGHVLFVPEIRALLPAARFVHVLRDARDTVASLLGASRSWGRAWAPRQARQAAGTWVSHVQAARQAQGTLPAAQFFEVRYEALHTDGPRVLRRLIDWLGVPWTDAEIGAAFERNNPAAARAGQGTPIPLGGEFAGSVGPVVKEPEGFVRQARAGSWRNELTTLDKVAVWHVARTTMAQAGYPWSTPWSR